MSEKLNINIIRRECHLMDKEDIYNWILGDENKINSLQQRIDKVIPILEDLFYRLTYYSGFKENQFPVREIKKTISILKGENNEI